MKGRIAHRWEQLAAVGRKALVPYVTPEYPLRDATVPVLKALDDAGADMIEVGIPYSDPIADGPTIQLSSEVALRNGATIPTILDAVRRFRQERELPILLMGYVNPILRMGLEVFVRQSSAAGVDGLIIPDLPPEEARELIDVAARHRMSLVFLIARTTADARIRMIDSLSTDFSYCVSMTGVTGMRPGMAHRDELDGYLQRVRRSVSKRFVVGFGISTTEQVAAVWRHADGAVVGSALLKAMAPARSAGQAATLGADFFASLRPKEPHHV